MKKLRVLLAEDDREARDAYRMRLEADGHHVDHATSALKAIDLVLNEPPVDLVLLDFELDGMLPGTEVAKYLRKTAVATGKPAPVVVLMTAYTPEQLEDRLRVVNPLEGISLIFFKAQDDFTKLWRVVDKMAGKIPPTTPPPP